MRKVYILLQILVQCWEGDRHGDYHTPHRGQCSEGSYWGSETDEGQLEPGSRTDAQRCNRRHQEGEDQTPITQLHINVHSMTTADYFWRKICLLTACIQLPESLSKHCSQETLYFWQFKNPHFVNVAVCGQHAFHILKLICEMTHILASLLLELSHKAKFLALGPC